MTENIHRTGPTIDSPGGIEYTPVTADVQNIMRRRFENTLTTAVHPTKPGYLVHGVENFWDGPSEVKDNGNGTYTYTSPYTGRVDTFSADTFAAGEPDDIDNISLEQCEHGMSANWCAGPDHYPADM